MIYLVKIKPRIGKSKTKGAIGLGNTKWKRFKTDDDPTTFAIFAANPSDLYEKLHRSFLPGDDRRLAGRTYLSSKYCCPIKNGDVISLPAWSDAGVVLGINDSKVEIKHNGEIKTFDLTDIVDCVVR